MPRLPLTIEQLAMRSDSRTQSSIWTGMECLHFDRQEDDQATGQALLSKTGRDFSLDRQDQALALTPGIVARNQDHRDHGKPGEDYDPLQQDLSDYEFEKQPSRALAAKQVVQGSLRRLPCSRLEARQIFDYSVQAPLRLRVIT